MRNYHRWFGTVAAVFLLFIAVTGILLQLDLWTRGSATPGAEEREGPPPRIALPDDATLMPMLATATRAIRERHPEASARAIAIDLGGPQPIASFGSGGPFPRVQIDMRTGADIPPPPRQPNFHNLLQDLHAGYRFGLVGRLISVAAGSSLLVLSVTGFMVYWDMFKRRKKAGKKKLFWR